MCQNKGLVGRVQSAVGLLLVSLLALPVFLVLLLTFFLFFFGQACLGTNPPVNTRINGLIGPFSSSHDAAMETAKPPERPLTHSRTERLARCQGNVSLLMKQGQTPNTHDYDTHTHTQSTEGSHAHTRTVFHVCDCSRKRIHTHTQTTPHTHTH